MTYTTQVQPDDDVVAARYDEWLSSPEVQDFLSMIPILYAGVKDMSYEERMALEMRSWWAVPVREWVADPQKWPLLVSNYDAGTVYSTRERILGQARHAIAMDELRRHPKQNGYTYTIFNDGSLGIVHDKTPTSKPEQARTKVDKTKPYYQQQRLKGRRW